jgi:hypothetical protein
MEQWPITIRPSGSIPITALAYNNRGIVKRNKGDIDGAIADFDRAITINPKYANAYRNRVLRSKRKGTTTEPSQTLIVL